MSDEFTSGVDGVDNRFGRQACRGPTSIPPVRHNNGICKSILEIDISEPVPEYVTVKENLPELAATPGLVPENTKEDLAGLKPVEVKVEDLWMDVADLDATFLALLQHSPAAALKYSECTRMSA